MLTKHNYHNIENNWDAESILECCGTDPGDPTCGDCCYDTWQKELKTVSQSYTQAIEKSNQLQNKWNFIYTRRDTYKTWLDELDKAESYARDICNQLEILALQLDKIWYNACKAVEAIEILFCMIRDYYSQLDYLKSTYDDLQNCITKNNDPSLVKGQGILKFLDDYKQKLDALFKTRDDIIKSITDAIKLANLIANYVSTRDCCEEDNCYDPCAANQKPCSAYGSEGEIFYGFKTVICEWYNAFECDEECTDDSTQNQSNQQQKYPQHNQQQHNHENDCDEEHCELVPTFDFPICNNKYKNCIELWLEDDQAQLADVSGKLQEARKKKEALAACKTSLDNAIKAVDPKERCK